VEAVAQGWILISGVVGQEIMDQPAVDAQVKRFFKTPLVQHQFLLRGLQANDYEPQGIKDGVRTMFVVHCAAPGDGGFEMGNGDGASMALSQYDTVLVYDQDALDHFFVQAVADSRVNVFVLSEKPQAKAQSQAQTKAKAKAQTKAKAKTQAKTQAKAKAKTQAKAKAKGAGSGAGGSGAGGSGAGGSGAGGSSGPPPIVIDLAKDAETIDEDVVCVYVKHARRAAPVEVRAVSFVLV
jgi:hypothetical protein